MTTEEAPAFVAGESGLTIAVPEAAPVVGEYSDVPPHVTVLYPFLREERLDSATLAELAKLLAKHEEFELELDHCARFPDVLYLGLADERPVRTLTNDVAARWPEAPPYEDVFDDAVPHLTVVQGPTSAAFDEVEAAITPRLPIRTHVTSIDLIVCDGTSWHRRASFPLRRSGEQRP